MLYTCTCRCHERNQVENYVMLAKKIQFTINDTMLFKLTGCLSKCDKYHYIAHPRTELKVYHPPPGQNIPTFEISFTIPNGRNEVKEQVIN